MGHKSHVWVNHGSSESHVGHVGSFMGHTWVSHGSYGSYMGQPWIMWVTYGIMYWSTMGRVGHAKRTLVIETPGYSGPLPFRNEGP